jgi:hypothetical protein
VNDGQTRFAQGPVLRLLLLIVVAAALIGWFAFRGRTGQHLGDDVLMRPFRECAAESGITFHMDFRLSE